VVETSIPNLLGNGEHGGAALPVRPFTINDAPDAWDIPSAARGCQGRNHRIAVARAATTVGLAAPAWAGQSVSARIDFGALQTDVHGAFHHKGDWVQLVDSCNNQAVSYIQVRGPFHRGTKTYYVTKPGESHRCGTRCINRNFPLREQDWT
jgi:hypothetical protein